MLLARLLLIARVDEAAQTELLQLAAADRRGCSEKLLQQWTDIDLYIDEHLR